MLNANGSDRRKAPRLTEQELNAMAEELQQMLELRRQASTAVVIAIDGNEQTKASATLNATAHAQLEARETSKLIEVWSREKDKQDILLTAFLLSRDSGEYTATLEAGQEITFGVDYIEDDEGNGYFDVNIHYRETNLVRKVSLAWQHATRGARGSRSLWEAQPGWVLAGLLTLAVLGGLMVAAVSSGGLGGLHARVLSELSGRKERASLTLQESPSAGEQSPTKSPTSDSASSSSGLDETARVHKGTGNPALRRNGREATTRNAHTARGAEEPRLESLKSVRDIYVEKVGIYDTADLNSQVQSTQIDRLRLSGVFQPTEDPDRAQARLRLVSDFEGGSGEKAQALLVTAKDGKVIWYGPLLSISSDTDAEHGREELSNLVIKSINNLILKKKKELSSRSSLDFRESRENPFPDESKRQR